MGELAEMIVEGKMCSWCGVCFEEEHGYPVACKDCWKTTDAEKRKKSGVQKAVFAEL